jgi:hypothetical protein
MIESSLDFFFESHVIPHVGDGEEAEESPFLALVVGAYETRVKTCFLGEPL